MQFSNCSVRNDVERAVIMAQTTVGVIGLGIMGGAIARNLLAVRMCVRGYDIDASRFEALKPNGIAATSAGEAARGADVVLTSLPSAKALDETVASLLAANVRGLVVAELSTLPIEAKEKARAALAAGGIASLDCPLSGTGAQAVTRDLAVYASGERAAYDRAEPVFRGFARATHYLGAFGNGSKMKFIANLLVAVHNVASAEAMVLGMKAGLDPETIVKVIASGAGNSRVFELRAPLMGAGNYAPTMKIDIWQKDMAIIADFAKALGVPVPTFAASAPVYNEAQAAGRGGEDTAAVAEIIAQQAGLKR
ncbi:MAG TPA: NAD(P)-dependent oxidoreductase [Stellaceae bacterium]|nr:NAD(P)-dependent oxidoreductase [Stellaceae bacterium]